MPTFAYTGRVTMQNKLANSKWQEFAGGHGKHVRHPYSVTNDLREMQMTTDSDGFTTWTNVSL